MRDDWTIRRRHLPHVDVEGKPYFVTACLKGSIPAAGLQAIRNYEDELFAKPCPASMDQAQWAMHRHKMVFKMIDDLLDGDPPVNHLRDARLAEIVQNAFLHFADVRYLLFAFVIMPSHHHWMFLPQPNWVATIGENKKRTPRETISHSIQSYTANRCHQLLQKTGEFWQQETYDHYARDEEEMKRIITYIEHNPVKAGLVDRAEDFVWSSAHYRQQHGIGPFDPLSVG